MMELSQKGSLTDQEEKQLVLLRDALSTFVETEFFVFHRNDKGGKNRYAPVCPQHQELVVRRMTEAGPDGLVFWHVHDGADIHHYRGIYCMELYKLYARKIEDIPYDKINRGSGKKYQSDVYICRSDESGRKYDRRALLKCSRALGHNRACVVARNYLYGL